MSEYRKSSYNKSSAGAGETSSSEPLDITSGKVAIIDHFMLSNNQFLSLLSGDEAVGIDEALNTYGGCELELTPGHYRVIRNPYLQAIVICTAEGNSEWYDLSNSECIGKIMGRKENMTKVGEAFIDTRCLALFDSDLLGNGELLSQYKALRENGRDKPARDFLRENGAAVRYGFGKLGDELEIHRLNEQIIAMWPKKEKSTTNEETQAN